MGMSQLESEDIQYITLNKESDSLDSSFYLGPMELDIYQVDAFSNGPFTGNPAAVVPLDSWLPDDILQKIAEENNLSETAFFTKEKDLYHIRWFTPGVEVNLCGHATLASAYVIYNELGYEGDVIRFTCKSGPISVSKKDDLLMLDFPSDDAQRLDDIPELISEALKVDIIEAYQGKDDIMCIVDNQSQIESLEPNFGLLKTLDVRGVLVTAPGNNEYDFVSRGFFPATGIDEDPATGSAHTLLSPYWANRLNKTEFKACQLSKRKGYLDCMYKGDRTHISGRADIYLRGKIII